MSVQFVPFAAEHAAGVRELILPIQQEEFGIPISYADQPDLHDIPAFYRRGTGEFWVALHDDEVVGSIALIDIGNRQGALRKMFVKEAWRGGAKGVASGLLAGLLDHARRQGLAEIYLGTTAKFLAAHRFYEKAGFDLVAEGDLPDNFPRMAVDTRFYRYRFDRT